MVPSFIIHKFTGWDYFDSTYFSMVTFTTVGFGDLTITDYDLKFMINFFSYFRLPRPQTMSYSFLHSSLALLGVVW